jgi:predicted acetyltransferase
MARIELVEAGPQLRPVIENLMQFYIHDFSDFLVHGNRKTLGEDGRFFDYPLDPYWRDAGRMALLIRSNGLLAGFALVNDQGHTDAATDFNMAEFFITRGHRRGGTGTAAAQAIFARRPGRWEVAVARRNTPALPFWRRAIEGFDRAVDIDETDQNDARWNGTLFRFRVLAD